MPHAEVMENERPLRHGEAPELATAILRRMQKILAKRCGWMANAFRQSGTLNFAHGVTTPGCQ